MMNLKEHLSSFVIFHGPPFVGKSSYFASELSDTFKRISPNELFRTNSQLTLRQLINNYIIKPLLNGEKVAVDDSMQTMAVRRSYVSTVLSKIPNINCTCLAFSPEFGKTQLLWKREILLAEAVLNDQTTSVESIFASDIDIWYGMYEPVLDVEELKKFEVTLPLQVYSRHPFQIPCLMVECKGVPDAKVASLMENWFRQNKRGRIIAIYESDRNTRTEEVQKSVLEFLKSIQLRSDLVVWAYLVDVGSHGDLTSFTTSVLAFLMRLHCLNLFSLNSVYLYESVKHRRMVESVGMRHIKLARALTNADLLRHGTTQFPVPKMLQSMNVVLPSGEGKEENVDAPRVPLLQEAIESDNCIAETSVGNHRMMYIAAKNADMLRRYQEQLQNPPLDVVNCSRSGPKSSIGQKRRLPSSSFKVLPSWMICKRKKTTGQVSRSIDGAAGRLETGRGRGIVVPSTVYIMSEQELLKTALMILGEGRRTDQRDHSDASGNGSFRDGKKLIRKGKSELKEEAILNEAHDEKATRLQLKSGACHIQDKDCMDFCHESDTAEERKANCKSEQQRKHSNTSQNSSEKPLLKSSRFCSSTRSAKSSCTNYLKNAVISSDNASANDVCQMFVDRVPDSKFAVSSSYCRKTLYTHQSKKNLLKSVHRKESPEITHGSCQQVGNSSNSRDVSNDVDEMNFMDEVLNGIVSKVRPNSTNRDVSAAGLGSPVDKKLLQKSDSDISHFIDSLIT